MQESPKTITLKVSPLLKHELKKLAKADNRTLHGYIVNVLKNKISEQKN